MSAPTIKLMSSDGEIFEVEVKVTQLSLYIKDMLDILGVEKTVVISIPENAPEISGAILKKILEWASYHQKCDPVETDDDEMKDKPINDIGSWDAQFLQVDHTVLFLMIRAANYLHIQGLLDVTCKKVAKVIKGMTLKQVRRTFQIQNDFTADEEEQVYKEYAWCEETHFAENNTPVNDNVMDNIPMDIQDLDNTGGQVMQECLNNSLVVREICQNLSDKVLVKFSLLNKLWNYETRSAMRTRGNMIATIDCSSSCQAVQAFAADLQQMNIVPFSGMKIAFPASHDSCQCAMSAMDSIVDVIFDPLPFKTLTVRSGSNRWDQEDCRGFLLAKRILKDLIVVVEDLSIINFNPGTVGSPIFVQECSYPRLQILKLEDLTHWSYFKYFKDFIGSAPNLREVHSPGPTRKLLELVEGSTVTPVCSIEVRYPFVEISDDANFLHMINSSLRLQKMKLTWTDGSFNVDGFMRKVPALLQAPCTSTLSELIVDAELFTPLLCIGVDFKNVRKLTVNITLAPRAHAHHGEILKRVDFTRMFPNLTKVHFTVKEFYADVPYGFNTFIEQANVGCSEPTRDRAVNIKELHLYDNVLNLYTVPFAEIFPNIERLHLEGDSGAYQLESVFKYWADLEEIYIKSAHVQDTANFDCSFCGIYFDEVVQLMQKDAAYLQNVNIVPANPSITCLKNLTVLDLEFDPSCRPDPVIHDVANPMFFLSKITGLVALARCPNLAVTLKISPDGVQAVSHLRPYLSILQ